MLVRAVVLYIQRDDGSIYEKHLFNGIEVHRWQTACAFAGIPILKIEQCVVFIQQ